MNDVMIRLAGLKDAPTVACLLFDAFAEYRPLYTDGGYAATAISAAEVATRMREGLVWVALCENVVVGTISVVRKGNSLYIRGMAVHPQSRGHRIGESLLKQTEDYAKRHSLSRLFLSTTPFLDRAFGLYEKFGFRRIDEGPHELLGTPLFTMEKLLLHDDLRKIS
jgi:N-acetylglutamate synthase-like GNAT family acetyltransferase